MATSESNRSESQSDSPPVPPARLWQALIPVLALVVMIYWSVVKFGTSAHLALILATAVAGIVGLAIGFPWRTMERGIVEGITIGLQAILILLVIGMLIATWIVSGIVPIMIYYGLKLLNPSIFLVATCVICCIVSLATGSSWTTAGTVGVALIGVGQGLGVPLPMVAGAIISGAYFGDKISPLSDTTNLAPAVAGSELFEHVSYMLYTTTPSLLIALTLYGILGYHIEGHVENNAAVESIRATLNSHFHLHPVLIIPPLLVILMVVFRLPALPALLGGVLLGALLGILVQKASLLDVVTAAYDGYQSNTKVAAVDALLSRGGLKSMLETVALILCALGFGGIMERTGMLAVLAGAVLKMARNTGSLVAATVITCFGMNILAPDQYLSIVVPGRMYREAYQQKGLEPRLLSRTLEDAGTLSSPLVAWNTCGAFMGKTLGVTAMVYAPYAFLNLINPVVAIVIAFLGWKIVKRAPSHGARTTESASS
jgi:Na+:H+ antiporter, NhaC family